MTEFYTLTVLLINQLGEIGEISFLLQRGPNLPLDARTSLVTYETHLVCKL